MRRKHSEPNLGDDATVLGAQAFAAISVVEGLKLTPDCRNRGYGDAPIEQRREAVHRAYIDLKGPKCARRLRRLRAVGLVVDDVQRAAFELPQVP